MRSGKLLGAALALAAAAAAGLALHGPAGRWARHAAGQVLGLGALLERRLQRNEEPLFAHLAASQVGYGPAQRKQFTSPTPFTAFVVEDERDGRVSWTGAGPVGTLSTEVLGPLGQVWVG